MADENRREQDELIREIQDDARLTARRTGRTRISDRVIDALRQVPRDEFVSSSQRPFAYVNAPLPIGSGQTISQPFIVALMTELLEPLADHIVLEVGTGSGYQAAVLGLLAKRVYSIEVVAALAETARRRLAELGYGNVEVRQGDGNQGWPAHAPFDRIIVTAAAPEIPPALIEQLKPGGRMVIPLGRPYSAQNLLVITKDDRGGIHEASVLPVAFVPLVRAAPP